MKNKTIDKHTLKILKKKKIENLINMIKWKNKQYINIYKINSSMITSFK